jgi:hypothetical protein
MPSPIRRLPAVKPLSEILPSGTEGGKEFARIVHLLLFHEARRNGRKVSLYSDAAGDYGGLDSFVGDRFHVEGTTGYQYKFYTSPLSSEHRSKITESLQIASRNAKKHKLRKWVLITPNDFIEPPTRSDGGDVTWFENLRTDLKLNFELEHWGHTHLTGLFLDTPALCLYYYPELFEGGSQRKKTILDIRKRYSDNLGKLYREIQFVGMSVYKQEATKGIPMEHIYIPLTIVPEAVDDRSPSSQRVDPLSLLAPGRQNVILGDPGSGKSTLLRFLALAGNSRPLQERYKAKSDTRLSILITLRKYADELKSRPNLSLLDYIRESIQADFNLRDADYDFLEYFLEAGQSLLFFDGIDELPSSHFKEIIRDRIRSLVTTYPGNTSIVTSRIVGYDSPFRFDPKEFKHYRITKLLLPEIEQFIADWYRVRIENPKERDDNVEDLIRILRDEAHTAIRELAENPLLLTIVALVHRIDAVLPDERVVLYQKCTETLLNTWHTWKFRETENKSRGKVERRNRFRMEAIAHWMQCRSASSDKRQRAVVSHEDISKFLTEHIAQNEKPSDGDAEAEDLAHEFLEFIKKRAGLLIEVGDNQYSFVHLTFQEYLTASYITTICEKAGAKGLWEIISRHCSDSRWHEVIRLLVAGLKANESQRFVIARMIALKDDSKSFSKSQILGGLLLDGIEPAEERKQDIVRLLISSQCSASTVEAVRAVNAMIQNWIAKDSNNSLSFEAAVNWAIKNYRGQQRLNLALLALSLELPSEVTDKILEKTDSIQEKQMRLYRLIFAQTLSLQSGSDFDRELQVLSSIQKVFTVTDSLLNFVAASLQSVVGPLDVGVQARLAFESQLVALARGVGFGPFEDLMLNTIRISFDDQSEVYRWSIARRAGTGRRRPPLDPNNPLLVRGFPFNKIGQDTKVNSFGARVASLNRRRAGALGLKSLLKSWVGRESRSADAALSALGHNSYQLQHSADSLHNGFWQEFLAIPELQDAITEILVDLFSLRPTAQWAEALRKRLLPEIPRRMKIALPEVWMETLRCFTEKRFGESEIYIAAWLLVLDAWLKAYGYYDSGNPPLFESLVSLTKDIDVAPLRIAHAVRGTLYGSKPSSELLALLELEDREYRTIFKRCSWLSPRSKRGTPD